MTANAMFEEAEMVTPARKDQPIDVVPIFDRGESTTKQKVRKIKHAERRDQF